MKPRKEMNMEKLGTLGCALVLILAALVGVSAFFGWIFMLLWNAAIAPTSIFRC